MIPLEQTREYILGRKGEILIHSFAIEHGCMTFDVSGTANGRAPVLNSPFSNIVAPDALHIRNVPLWAEYKTKQNVYDWHGGSRYDEVRDPPCLAHGIDRRAFEHYQQADRKMPVVLWFLTVNTGQLHVASLSDLGQPFASRDPRWPMVNWPLSRMSLVVRFDTERLKAYFGRPERRLATTAAERRELLRTVGARQAEFDGFIEHFLTYRETLWGARQ